MGFDGKKRTVFSSVDAGILRKNLFVAFADDDLAPSGTRQLSSMLLTMWDT